LGIADDLSQSSPARAANLLGALSLAVWAEVRHAAECEGKLAGSEPAALVTLSQHPGQSVEALHRTLGITHSGAVRVADRLQSAGLLSRSPAGPGRTLALEPTAGGREAASAILARRERALERILAVLSPSECAALVAVAERLLAGLTEDRQSAARLCRLCDEGVCMHRATCPVDRAIR
jgi:DNA-binding MarR family transcriptional regulator